MAGELHEISRALGAVEANTAILLAGQREMTDQLQTLVPTVYSINQWAENDAKPKLAALTKDKWTRHGFTAGVAAVCGFLGSIIAKLPALITMLH